jgi:hypothetical protein
MARKQLIDDAQELPFYGLPLQSLALTDVCVRSITFTIPDASGGPGTQVYVVEQAGNLLFTVDVLDTPTVTADLRGLFFHVDESALAGLGIVDTDPIITQTRIGLNNVIDLGNGANMRGAVKGGFDIGIEFGRQGIGKGDDVNGPVSFTLDATHDLTLDALTHMMFGARLTSVGAPDGARGDSSKNVFVAPAAPDANDDSFRIFEDGASGLNAPSHTPVAAQFTVLANDTDADGDALSVTDFDDLPDHGSVAIAADGKSVLYTPDVDYAGSDSFVYCISDGNGGTDFATVNIVVDAVADIPDLVYTISPGNQVNEIVLRTTATQTDADSSEFIDRVLASVAGGVPAGVTIVPGGTNPGSEPDQIVQEFRITLPLDQDTNFNLEITATSKEVSNGDEQSKTVTIPIVYEFNSTTTPAEFVAEDQSIWSTGDQFVFVDDRFVGIDTGNFNESVGSVLFAGIDGHIKLGFQSTLTFEGGEIDATADYDVTVETNYNKTTDQLLIDTGALLTAAAFSTEGPQGSYTLDFIYDVLLHAFAGVNIDFGSIDFGPLGVLDLGGINERIDVGPITVGPGSFNILDLNSDSLAGTIELPPPLDAFSVNYAWPNITTSGTYPPNPVTADGASNNFLELNLDVDTLVTQLLGIPNVFDPPRIDVGPFFADLDLLDVDVTGGLNFLQKFGLSLGDLSGVLLFEDGSNQAFTIGSSLLISDAKLIDVGGDQDGLVEFQFAVVPTATLHNETDLGFNIGAEVKLLSLELGYDIEIFNPFGDNVHFTDSIALGPLADFGETVPVAEIPVFDDTFALDFAPNFAPTDLGFFA